MFPAECRLPVVSQYDQANHDDHERRRTALAFGFVQYLIQLAELGTIYWQTTVRVHGNVAVL